MHNVLWVTQDCFVDHDIDIVPLVSNYVKITWIILLPYKAARYEESDFTQISKDHSGLDILFLKFNDRMRNPKNMFVYNQLYKHSKRINPDVIHLDMDLINPWALPMLLRLPRKKTVLVVHQGAPHIGMKHNGFNNFIRKILFNRFVYVKMFSKSQADIFKSYFSKTRVFQFTLPLLNFGEASNTRPSEGKVRFLSFGIINYAKNIELLIDAAEALYDEGIKDFVVSINGSCADWSFYAARIKHPELFETDIRLIPNEAIPNLFTQSHFFVQPYRVVSQSGPLKIAYAYNIPVIVSDLPGFTDEVADGVTGFIFRKDDRESLQEVMKKAIMCYKNNYNELLVSMEEFVRKNYSEESIAENYLKMFKTVIRNGKYD